LSQKADSAVLECADHAVIKIIARENQIQCAQPEDPRVLWVGIDRPVDD
jgi:hypothetical protein